MRMSAVYYPSKGEVEITFEEEGEAVSVIACVNIDQGERVAEIVMPCVYHDMKEEKVE